MKKYAVQELVFGSSRGGLFESYLLVRTRQSEGGPKKSVTPPHNIGSPNNAHYALLQCLRVENNLRYARKEVQ